MPDKEIKLNLADKIKLEYYASMSIKNEFKTSDSLLKIEHKNKIISFFFKNKL